LCGKSHNSFIEELKEQAAELPYIKLKSFQYGKTAAMLSISDDLNFIEIVNKHTNKKKIEGLTVGEYLLLNIIGSTISEKLMPPGVVVVEYVILMVL